MLLALYSYVVSTIVVMLVLYKSNMGKLDNLTHYHFEENEGVCI